MPQRVRVHREAVLAERGERLRAQRQRKLLGVPAAP